MKQSYQLNFSDSDTVFIAHVKLASTFFERLRGLLGVNCLPVNEGMLFPKCKGVHTLGMSIPIDIIFLNRHNIVTSVYKNVLPGRFVFGHRSAVCALETASGVVGNKGLKVGDGLSFIKR